MSPVSHDLTGSTAVWTVSLCTLTHARHGHVIHKIFLIGMENMKTTCFALLHGSIIFNFTNFTKIMIFHSLQSSPQLSPKSLSFLWRYKLYFAQTSILHPPILTVWHPGQNFGGGDAIWAQHRFGSQWAWVDLDQWIWKSVDLGDGM